MVYKALSIEKGGPERRCPTLNAEREACRIERCLRGCRFERVNIVLQDTASKEMVIKLIRSCRQVSTIATGILI